LIGVRDKIKFHRECAGRVIWLTGLSGSGKTTIAKAIHKQLDDFFYHSFVLDGDIVRDGLSKDLNFSKENRAENIRRIAEVAKLFADSGVIVTVAFISPYEEDRALARQIIGEERFYEVFLNCPLKVCEERDVKGLYYKARQGLIKNFTGVSDPYEKPKYSNLSLETHVLTLQECVDKVFKLISKKEKPWSGLKYLTHFVI